MQNLELDPNKEYILAGDISSSMMTVDPLCGNNDRYNYMLEKFELFIKAAEDFDEHGAPTIILFGENVHVYEHMTLEKVKDKLSYPKFEGLTNLDLLIEKAFKLHKEDKSELYKQKKFHPGTQLLVFTDGAPSNIPAVERTIENIIHNIDSEDEFQINFLIVGTVEPRFQQWLDRLHDKMEDKKINPNDFDIIHVSKLENTNFLSVIGSNRHEGKVA